MVAEVLFAITDFLKRSAKGLMRALRLRAKNGTKKHLPLRGA